MKLRDNLALRLLLRNIGDERATAPVEETFHKAPLGTVASGTLMDDLAEVIIVAGTADAFIDSLSDTEQVRNVLTGQRVADNDCAIVFRHSFRSVRCDVQLVRMAQSAHIGFIRRGDFGEMQSFSLGAGRSGTLLTRLEYVADAPGEIQGIVWRGGLLQITGIGLTP